MRDIKNKQDSEVMGVAALMELMISRESGYNKQLKIIKDFDKNCAN